MSMNGPRMAAEILLAMGGTVNPDRQMAFTRMCEAIIRHIQINIEITSAGADPQGGTVTSTSTLVQ